MPESSHRASTGWRRAATFLQKRWRRLSGGLWFLPSGIALFFLLLAIVVSAVDRAVGVDLPLTYGGTASAAREIVVTIAGSIISVTGVVFSITIVTFQLVSAQYTPRALREFVSDRLTQTVAGVFIGIVVYCLLILRDIRVVTDDGEGFVPGIGVTIANVIAIGAMGLLVAFIHHISEMIQVANITARIHRATEASIHDLYPEMYGEPMEDASRTSSETRLVRAPRAGFIRSIDVEEMVAHDGLENLEIEIRVRPGDFVSKDDELAAVRPREGLDEGATRRIERAFVIGTARDVQEDALFGFQQLGDIAVKALSPGINDPTTALTAIAYLKSVSLLLTQRALPRTRRSYPSRNVVIVTPQVKYEEYVSEGLARIGHYTDGNPRVLEALLDALVKTARVAAERGATQRVAVLERVMEDVLKRASLEIRTESGNELLSSYRGRMSELASVEADVSVV